MLKFLAVLAALLASGLVQAQAASSPAKKELVAKVLQLQQGSIEVLARSLAERPAVQMMQQASAVLQRLPEDRREALARDIEADIRKYVEEATPIVRDKAVKLAPSTIGVLLDERFTEEELRQIIAIMESPVNRKFQGLFPEMQRAIGEKLVAETRGDVEPKVQALQQAVGKRLGATPPAATGTAPKAAGPAGSAAKK